MGYTEGAKLSRELGGWQVISWALVLSLPAMLVLAGLRWPENLAEVSAGAWLGLGYVAVFSMLIGFMFWYRGLALAASLLHEAVSPGMVGVTLAVILCVVGAKKFAQPVRVAAR